MWTRIALFSLVMTAPLAVARAAPPSDTSSSSSASDPSLIKPPPDTKLLGTSTVDEIRAFPEMGIKGLLTGKPEKAKIVGVTGVDRIFQTNGSFADTVSYFDGQFKQSGYQVTARLETPSATVWTVKRPDGTVANAVVRNTKPTTFELTEISAMSGTLRQ
jgi:hypothetical protein